MNFYLDFKPQWKSGNHIAIWDGSQLSRYAEEGNVDSGHRFHDFDMNSWLYYNWTLFFTNYLFVEDVCLWQDKRQIFQCSHTKFKITIKLKKVSYLFDKSRRIVITQLRQDPGDGTTEILLSSWYSTPKDSALKKHIMQIWPIVAVFTASSQFAAKLES